MSAVIRALSAEVVKLRRTLALWMCLIAPAVVVVLYVLQISLRELRMQPPDDGAGAWVAFSMSALGLWTFLMLPLFVTLQAALLAGLEHGERQWKHLLALPLPRSAHYLAKALILVAMVAAADAILILLIPLGGWVVSYTQPVFGIAGAPPWELLWSKALAMFLASLLMVALQLLIALRWRSFTVAVASGMTATVMGFLIGQSPRFGPWYPWSMAVQTMAQDQSHVQLVLVISVCGALIAVLVGLADFRRRDVD